MKLSAAARQIALRKALELVDAAPVSIQTKHPHNEALRLEKTFRIALEAAMQTGVQSTISNIERLTVEQDFYAVRVFLKEPNEDEVLRPILPPPIEGPLFPSK